MALNRVLVCNHAASSWVSSFCRVIEETRVPEQAHGDGIRYTTPPELA
jgi:hypothetical protein